MGRIISCICTVHPVHKLLGEPMLQQCRLRFVCRARCLMLASCSSFSHSSHLTPSSATLHRAQDRSQNQLHPSGVVQALSEGRGAVPGAFPAASSRWAGPCNTNQQSKPKAHLLQEDSTPHPPPPGATLDPEGTEVSEVGVSSSSRDSVFTRPEKGHHGVMCAWVKEAQGLVAPSKQGHPNQAWGWGRRRETGQVREEEGTEAPKGEKALLGASGNYKSSEPKC